jgi:hypothetical protein
MPLAKCPRCSRIFNKENSSVCPQCQAAEEADYKLVREALEEHPNLTPEQVSELTGVELSCILRLLDEGRIASRPEVEGEKKAVCSRCGAPAISPSIRLCKACLQELNAEIALAQASIKLNKRKKINLGTGMNVRRWSGDDF